MAAGSEDAAADEQISHVRTADCDIAIVVIAGDRDGLAISWYRMEWNRIAVENSRQTEKCETGQGGNGVAGLIRGDEPGNLGGSKVRAARSRPSSLPVDGH